MKSGKIDLLKNFRRKAPGEIALHIFVSAIFMAVGLMYKMDEKGVVLNSAFSVSAAFVFGSHLAFTMALDEAYIPAMMVGKLVAGVLAIFVAHYVYELRNGMLKEKKVYE